MEPREREILRAHNAQQCLYDCNKIDPIPFSLSSPSPSGRKKERHKFCENLCVVTSKRDYYVQEHRSRLRGYGRSIMQTTQASKSRTQISSRGRRASNRRCSRLQAASCLDGRLCRRPLWHNSHAGKSLANCSVSEEAAAAIEERLWRS